MWTDDESPGCECSSGQQAKGFSDQAMSARQTETNTNRVNNGLILNAHPCHYDGITHTMS